MDKPEIDERTKQKILEDIFQSEDFRQPTKYQELLRYLIYASDKGEVIKESTIAIELFGKDATFDPSMDSTVRAYISNLRKKLEHYYLTKGRGDSIQLRLPKGHYYIEFVQTKKIEAAPSKSSVKLPYLIFIPLIILLLLIIIYLGSERIFIKSNNPYLDKNKFIWNGWFDKNQKVMIVLGNFYFFKMPFEEGRNLYIRDLFINSDDDLVEFKKNYPSYKDKFQNTYNTYLDEHIPFCLNYILPSFLMNNKRIEIKLSSEVQLEDLRNYNIIYIGPYKCLNILKTITRNLHFKYIQNHVTLQWLQKDPNNTSTFLYEESPKTEFRVDYAMVVKVSGSYNNEFILFLSNYDFGNLSTVKHFTNPDSLENLKNQINSKYFEALFEVEGVTNVRMDLNSKLLHINLLHPDFKISID